jgi:hypothetical protein
VERDSRAAFARLENVGTKHRPRILLGALEKISTAPPEPVHPGGPDLAGVVLRARRQRAKADATRRIGSHAQNCATWESALRVHT